MTKICLRLLASFLILVSLSESQQRPPCKKSDSEFMPSAFITEDGNAWDPESSTLYPNGTYWHFREQETNATILMGCPCKLRRPCLRKCCQMGQEMDFAMKCVPRNSTHGDGGAWFRPEMAEEDGKAVLSVNGTKISLGVLTEKHCFPKHGRKLVKDQNFFIRASDASLCLIDEENVKCFGYDRFCIDYVHDRREYKPVLCPEKKTAWSVTFVHTERENMMVNIFKFFTQTVSALALFLVLLIYIKIPSLRSVHGMCHMCHSVSLLTYYTLLTILLHSEYLRKMNGICFILGPSEFLFHLAPLSWLNVMSVDILFAFLNLRPVGTNMKNEERRKFAVYSLYAWGVPILSFIITIIADFSQEKDEQPTLKDWCVTARFRNWDFKRYPMYILLTINGIIFALTAIKIYLLKRESRTLHSNDSRRHSKDIDNSNQRPTEFPHHSVHTRWVSIPDRDFIKRIENSIEAAFIWWNCDMVDTEAKNWVKMYLRLLLLMGFHWALEPLAKALHNVLRLDKRLAVRMIWYIIAIGNRLQGLFIFLMFTGNDKLTSALWIKLSKSKLWKKLTSRPSMRRVVIATIALDNIARKVGVRKSIDSTDTTENELTDSSKSDYAESSMHTNRALQRTFSLPTTPPATITHHL